MLLLLALLPACTREQWHRAPGPDDVVSAVPWFSTMKRGPAIQPYAMPPREPVPGTVPITGSDPDLRIDRDEDLPVLNRLRNPAARTAESLERGKELFAIYCLPCHGPLGQGDGPITPKFVPPPSLTAAQARQYSDGYLNALIRHGRGIMPSYGDKVRGIDRWHLVNYLRLLQDTNR